MAYNLRSLKDNKKILPLIMAELFFRTVRHFEDINALDVPNYLDVDEFHAMSKFDYIVDIIVRSVRTWGKYKGGVGLWSQSAKDFGDLPHWPALRSAASTFFFMADPSMDADLYKEVFLLSEGECEAIRDLRPKREAYIVQRDIGISKKVVLEVEPEQHVISTSRATEAAVRRKNMQRYSDVEAAIAVTAHEIGLAEKPASAEYDLDERVA
jgi:type IV secretion system protein VirB4